MPRAGGAGRSPSVSRRKAPTSSQSTSADRPPRPTTPGRARTIDTNLTGSFFTARATIPTLIEQGDGGAIVFISSVAGLRGLPFLADYAASKHGIVGLAKTMANELGRYNIRVNTVHPHGVATGMQPARMGELIGEYAATLAPLFMGALPDPITQPDDIAGAVAWLASHESPLRNRNPATCRPRHAGPLTASS